MSNMYFWIVKPEERTVESMEVGKIKQINCKLFMKIVIDGDGLAPKGRSFQVHVAEYKKQHESCA